MNKLGVNIFVTDINSPVDRSCTQSGWRVGCHMTDGRGLGGSHTAAPLGSISIVLPATVDSAGEFFVHSLLLVETTILFAYGFSTAVSGHWSGDPRLGRPTAKTTTVATPTTPSFERPCAIPSSASVSSGGPTVSGPSQHRETKGSTSSIKGRDCPDRSDPCRPGEVSGSGVWTSIPAALPSRSRTNESHSTQR